MIRGYTVMRGKKASRINTVVFAALAIVVVAVAQFVHTATGGEVRPEFFFAYAPAIAMIFAAIFRSYLMYFLAALFYTAHQFISILFLSMQSGTYTGFELFETVTEYILFAVAACLLWQVILFWAGHANIVAVTHTTMVFVIAALLLTFLPYIIHAFSVDIYITDSYNVVALGISFIAFAHGIEKKSEEEENA